MIVQTAFLNTCTFHGVSLRSHRAASCARAFAAVHAYLPIKIVPPPSDELVEVGVHELEHQRQPAGGLVIQNFL